MQYALSCARSATAPETMVAAVAEKAHLRKRRQGGTGQVGHRTNHRWLPYI